MRRSIPQSALALLFGLVLSLGAARANGIVEVKSSSGVSAWLIEDHTLPLIAVEFQFDGGTALDPPGQEGRANLAMDLLAEGAGEFDSHAFKSRVGERFGRDKLTLGVVGDITPQRLAALLDRTFGSLPAHAGAAAVAETAAFDEAALLVVNMPIPQSVVAFGERGIKRDDPDWYVALVMNEILAGNGLTSRLTAEIREKRGLAYGVGAGLSPLRPAGILYGSGATRTDRAGAVL